MSTIRIRLVIAGVSALTLLGCAGQAGPRASPEGVFSQQDLADLRAHYRQEALDLRDMAKRRTLEADILAKQTGPDDPQVRRKRDLAEDLMSAANEAEEKGRTIRRQMPHNMVQ